MFYKGFHKSHGIKPIKADPNKDGKQNKQYVSTIHNQQPTTLSPKMKYYETSFEEYLQAVEKRDFHPELIQDNKQTVNTLNDIIWYGPSGVGKYSQALKFLQPLSPSRLAYYKKLSVVFTDGSKKIPITVPMSDIHFEVDMSLLGCKAKKLWHKIFFQIVDILKLRENKHGIIICKNFHSIHSELLDIFYSYMQHYRPRGVNIPNSSDGDTNVQVSFMLISDHVSFIPNAIHQRCSVISVRRPSLEDIQYKITSAISVAKPEGAATAKHFLKRITHSKKQEHNNQEMAYKYAMLLSNAVDSQQVLNLKEYNCFNLFPQPHPHTGFTVNPQPQQHQQQINILRQHIGKYSDDVFNKICDQIIEKIAYLPGGEKNSSKWFATFRDAIYAILICNLDASECVCHILNFLLHMNYPAITNECQSPSYPLPVMQELSQKSVYKIMKSMYTFLLYYNNNYRPIYHLESIFLKIIVELYRFPEYQSAPNLKL